MSAGMLSLQLTVTGMGTVFAILSILGVTMHLFKIIFGRATCPAVAAGVIPGQTEAADPRDDQEELAAVIAAASHFARMKWKQPVLVKAVTPVWDEKHRSSWLDAGRQEIINARLELRRAQ